MKNEIILVYPEDSTTDFLQGIPDFLFDKYGENRFIHHRINTSEVDVQKCLSAIAKSNSETFIVFLGHGSSRGLLGARSGIEDPKLLVEHSNSHFLRNKSVFSLSCRSADFFKAQQITGIGFGDLTTEWAEVIGRREAENNAYRHHKGDIDEKDIKHANELLVDVVRFSLHYAIAHQLSMEGLHLHLKLRFNRAIFKLISENKPSEVRWVANLLLEAKTEMKLFT